MSLAVIELLSLYLSVTSNAFLILRSVQQINADIIKPKKDNIISIVKISPFLFIFHHLTYIRKLLYYSVF